MRHVSPLLAPWVLALVVSTADSRPIVMVSPAPQSPAPQQPSDGPAVAPTVGVTASRVAVDLVIRDKKGRLLRDLKKTEIAVLEDGVPQEVLSLRLVDTVGGARALPPPAAGRPTPPSAAPEGPAAGGPPGADEHPLLLAFLFDRLSPNARRLAHDAAVDWLRRPAPPGRQVGVFRIDQGLETLAPFGSDPAVAEQAVDLILTSGPATHQSKADRERLRGLRNSLLAVDASPSPQAAAGPMPAESAGLEVGVPGSTTGVNPLQKSMVKAGLRLQMAMIEAFEALERDQQGLSTVNSILALVSGLRSAPGRKAVVLFSEGLLLPPQVASALQSVVSEANRSGITFYAADAAGLRTVSGSDEARREMAAIVEEAAQAQLQGGHSEPGQSRNPESQATQGSLAGTASGRPMTATLERNEDILRSDPASGLGTLARGTGGFLVTGSNEIGRALQAAEEDLGAYYLLEYAPGNELWDGRFRRIEVKVRRSNVRVQARQGYFAVRTTMPTPLLDYESPVLAALEMAPRANDLVFRSTVAQVPDQADETAVPVLVEVAGDVPTLDLDQKQERYQQDFTVLVLVRDADGHVVRKLSRRFLSAGPLEKADEARRGRILILRETWLPPGRYTVEAAVQDAASGRLGVQRTPLDIPAQTQALRVGSLVLVGHAAPRGEGPPDSPALVAQGMQLYPNAAGKVSAASGKPLPFFLVASPVAGRDAPRASIELRQGETPVFSAPAEFTRAVGRATLLGGIPLDGIPPGAYELRVTVADGVDRAVRWAKVTITP